MDEDEYKIKKSLLYNSKAPADKPRAPEYHYSMRLLSTDRLFRMIAAKQSNLVRHSWGRLQLNNSIADLNNEKKSIFEE